MAEYMTFIDSIQQEIAEFEQKQAEGTTREEARCVTFLNDESSNYSSSLTML
jgi:urea carboxylase